MCIRDSAKTKITAMYNTYLKGNQTNLDELKSKINSGEVVVPVPNSTTIADLRKQNIGTFSYKFSVTVSANPSSPTTTTSSAITVAVTLGGAPVSGASVTLSTTGGSLSPTSGSTDSNGRFTSTYTSGDTGTFTITASVSKSGFASKSGNAQVTVTGIPVTWMYAGGAIVLIVVLVVIYYFFIRKKPT